MINTLKPTDLNRQRGAASLLTALVILIGITLITLATSKAVLVETQITADNYRSTQAVAAANYALDYGFNYFDNGGFDQDGTPGIDTVNVPDLTSADDSQTTTATLAFDNAADTRCTPPGYTTNMSNGMITAQGFSDDEIATRTITQCVGPMNILANDGPEQPLVSQASVGLTGNARIINRYTDTTIWAGGRTIIGSSATMETYINNPADPAVTDDDRLNTSDSFHTQLVSNRNLGNGLDIIDDDPSLGNLKGLDFFRNFFLAESRQQLKELAGDQAYTDIDDAIGKSGLIWIDGDQDLAGGTIGSPDSPAILIVNGDLKLTGGTIYGIVYVVGTYDVAGNPIIIGSSIVEGTDLATGDPATPPIVSGHGTLTLVFWPAFESTNGFPPGLSAVISGSWRDW
jgi:Tfp pilus assembly protein PilX